MKIQMEVWACNRASNKKYCKANNLYTRKTIDPELGKKMGLNFLSKNCKK